MISTETQDAAEKTAEALRAASNQILSARGFWDGVGPGLMPQIEARLMLLALDAAVAAETCDISAAAAAAVGSGPVTMETLSRSEAKLRAPPERRPVIMAALLAEAGG